MHWTWINPPSEWSGDASALELVTDDQTDFWQETFYGFQRNSGHAFLAPVEADFTLSARTTGDYEALYDQAGLMLHVNERNWVKAGIEYTDGLMHFSVVVIREVSDWSVIPLPAAKPSDELDLRLTRHGDAVRIQYRIGAMAAWQMARLAPSRPPPRRPESWPARPSGPAFAPASATS